MKHSLIIASVHREYLKSVTIVLFMMLMVFQVQAQETLDIGKTGWEVKRPVMAAACESGCPWGELGDFNILAGFLASPSMNPESSYWTVLSQKFDLYFMELPEELLKQIASQNIDAEFVEVHQKLLRGINRNIRTLGRSGEAIFARDDTPEQAAYDLAKAIDENHGALKWFIRVYTYDPKTVWQNFGVPLHPGAERYYREVGYMKNP